MGRGRRGRASPALLRRPAGSAWRVGGEAAGLRSLPRGGDDGPETPHRFRGGGRTPLKSGWYLA